MKDIRKSIEYQGEEYPIVFNLNVMEALQDEYGRLEKWGELTDGEGDEPNIKAVITGFTFMINEGIEIENDETGTKRPLLTRKQVGRIVTEVGFKEATRILNKTVEESTREEGEEKN